MQTPIICFSSFPVSFSQKIMVYTFVCTALWILHKKSSELTKRNQKMVLHIAAALPITGKRRFAQCIRCLHGMRERNLNLKRFSSKVLFFFSDTTSLLVFMEIILCCTDGKKNILFSHSGPH